MNDQTETLAIHAAYQDRLAKAIESPMHAGALAPEAGLELVQVTSEGVTLTALVDPATHTVRRAAYSGTLTTVQRGLLETLCHIMAGRPMLECSDHAAIYLEHGLRDPSHPRPVSGIVTPNNADPVFQLPHKLVRALAQTYWNATGSSGPGGENFFDPPASPAWRALSPEERLQRVQRALVDIRATLQLPDTAIASVTVEGVTRVFLDLAVDMPSAAKGALLMTLEAQLKARVEDKLHVYMIERKDLNKIRRLATPNSGSPTTAV